MGKRKVVKNAARFTFTILILLTIAVFGVYGYYNSNLEAASKDGKETEIVIPRGTSVKGIGAILEKQGIIKNANVFYLYGKLSDKGEKVQAGSYVLSSSMTVPEIMDKLAAGKAKMDTARFTIPEGFEFREIADKLSEQGLADKEELYKAVNAASYKYDFIKDIPERENRLEGYLFPDTYEIYKNATEEEIIDKMLSRFNSVLTEEYRQRAKELNMSIDDVIILASVIEREAKLDSERKTVSAVFHNRLDKKMKLQSCATVQYILKERKPVLTYKDLEIDSPYNTYMYEGLPDGPIASPGAKSIEAALYPDNVDYLYFVAKDDGSHVFTRTYQEHLNAQNKIKQSKQ